MNDIISISGVRGYIDKNGVAHLNAEDVARGWGFVQIQIKNGKQYTSIRWERVNGYLKEFGFPPQVGENDFIPENMVYRLGFKASNETAQNFQALLADEVLPAIRKTGSYQARPYPDDLSPQLQLLINLELKQKEQERQIAEVNQRVDNIREVVALSPNDWRRDCQSLIKRMAQAIGGYEHIRTLTSESYKLLNERMGVDLQCRLTNKRRRMADEGVCKSKRDKLNLLDVIADDKKLIEGYVAIIKEMAIKYGAEKTA